MTISTQALSKRFNREWIFRDLTLTFQPGNIYCFTGPNGSGKSTLLQVLWGQLPQSSGLLEYRLAENIIPLQEVYQHISIAAPYMDLIEEFTLQEMLDFHFKLKKLRGVSSLDELIALMYLQSARDKAISNFSSGMKQRLKLGLAFYSQAYAIFLDEPGTNLDANAFAWYREQLARVPADATVLMASNDPNEYPASAQKLDIMAYKQRN